MNYNRSYHSKYYNVLKLERGLTLEVYAIKITNYIKKIHK